jgi:hypothetical protein
MFAVIENSDRFVVQYRTNEGKTIGVLATEEVGDTEVFYNVWERRDGKYQIMWRGSFESCMKDFTEIVGDLFTDDEHEKRQAFLRETESATANA